MENEMQFAFHFLIKKLKNELLKQININFYDHYHKYGLHVIQEPVRVKSPEVFRYAMVTRTPRIRCLKQLSYFNVYILAATFIFGSFS